MNPGCGVYAKLCLF